MAYKINQNLCILCGTCEDHCPIKAIKHDETDNLYIDENICAECGSCESCCPNNAIYI